MQVKPNNDTRTVDIHVQRLRKKLNWDNVIVTVFKYGYRFEMNDYAVKRVCSQGQQKSFLIALKLSQFELLKALEPYVKQQYMPDNLKDKK